MEMYRAEMRPVPRREGPPLQPLNLHLTFGRPYVNYDFMIRRPFWTQSLSAAWKKRPIVWLAGVRRVGKTTLARMLPDAVYLNCDLPSVERRLEDPELFLRSQPRGTLVVLDEVHRLPEPTRALKIAADAFSHLRRLRLSGLEISDLLSDLEDRLFKR